MITDKKTGFFNGPLYLEGTYLQLGKSNCL